jgi:sialic acid synthase SpsE
MPGDGYHSGYTRQKRPAPQFVAEVSSNHHRDLDRCRSFIRTAAAIGCDAVKFQLFRVRELFAPEALVHEPTLLARQDWELPVAFLPELASCCREVGIQFSCTPFYLKAVQELFPFVDAYKIASYELLWDDLLVACSLTRKPVVLATGMATLAEIGHAVQVLRDAGCLQPTLLHCVSCYPARPEDCNLSAIDTLRSACHCQVGWSDHSVQPGVVHRAIHRWGASIIEFHLDLEGQGEEFRAGHCWLPEQIRPVIASVRAGLTADGEGKKAPRVVELKEREWRADPSDGLRPLRETRTGLGAR